MRGMLAVAKREIFSFFVSPVAYVVLTVWLVYQGFTLYMLSAYFAQSQYDAGAVSQNPLTMFFGGTTLFYVILLVIASVLTMRLLAEERRSGTLEPLQTVPLSEVSLVLGKYLAAMVFWVTLWIPTVIYIWILKRYGALDWGVAASSYVGVLGIGAFYMAVGVLMSAASPNQIIAAVLTFMLLGGLFLVGVGEFIFDGPAKEGFAYISVWGHMTDFSKGIVDSRHLVFDFSLAVLALFLAVRVMQSRRYDA
jgi:ABC-2 type transport system permease protein